MLTKEEYFDLDECAFVLYSKNMECLSVYLVIKYLIVCA